MMKEKRRDISILAETSHLYRQKDLNTMNNLQKRLLDFSVLVFETVQPIKNDLLLGPIASQLIRSATSAGANYSESQSGSSIRDFHNKAKIALKELKESQFWITFLLKTGLKTSNLQKLAMEVEELIRILSTISKKTDPRRIPSP